MLYKILSINEDYTTLIKGIGELYEIISVRKLQKQIRKTHRCGYLILWPSTKPFPPILTQKHIVYSGGVDNPPWPSRPSNKENIFIKNRAFMSCIKPLLYILCEFENFRPFSKAHILYAFYKS